MEADGHYRQAQQFLACGDWAPAEGWLWWLRQHRGWQGVVLIDQPLGCCLVMQGEYQLAWELLEPLLDHPQRNPWVAHLAADARRGCNRLDQAVALYRQALADGSDSPLTARNLLQVLWQRNGDSALAQLRAWHSGNQLQGVVLKGVQEALAPGQALPLEAWLARQGLATQEQLRRLAIAALERLDRAELQGLLAALERDPWAEALKQRLAVLQVEGFSGAGWDGGATGRVAG